MNLLFDLNEVENEEDFFNDAFADGIGKYAVSRRYPITGNYIG